MGITTSSHAQEKELHEACRTGHLQTVKKLIENKVNLNVFAKDQYTPLHVAVVCGHSDIVKLLLVNEVDINIRDGRYERTPLMEAAFYGRKEIFNLLIEFGADEKLTNKYKENVLHFTALLLFLLTQLKKCGHVTKLAISENQ